MEVQRRHAEAIETLRNNEHPRKYVPLVDEVWLKEQSTTKRRQRILVLEGPSKVGKTAFCKMIRGEDQTHEINCAGWREGQEPNLRGLDQAVHTAILFDEAPAKMILSQKRLFQAAPEFIQMGASATNIYGYEVSTHDKLLMVTSNSWSVELGVLQSTEIEWLQQNTVHVVTAELLWEEPQSSHSRSSLRWAPRPNIVFSGFSTLFVPLLSRCAFRLRSRFYSLGILGLRLPPVPSYLNSHVVVHLLARARILCNLARARACVTPGLW